MPIAYQVSDALQGVFFKVLSERIAQEICWITTDSVFQALLTIYYNLLEPEIHKEALFRRVYLSQNWIHQWDNGYVCVDGCFKF